MSGKRHRDVRELLRASPDGQTINALVEIFGWPHSDLRRVLANMPDAYIDRWTLGIGNTWQAVWCCITPPEHCPKPDRKKGRKA